MQAPANDAGSGVDRGFSNLSAAALAAALDGAVYLVDADGILLAVGGSAWTSFARTNDASDLTPDAVTGRSLFDMIDGEDVRDAYRRLHARVRASGSDARRFNYRCDSPGVERHMLMSISSLDDLNGARRILYQSQVLSETARLPMAMFSGDRNAVAGKGYADDQIVVLCSFCHDVAWPPGAPQEKRAWVKPEEYYRRGGRIDHVVSHGMCPGCFERVMSEAA